MTIAAGVPALRIFRVLDESRLSAAFKDANERFEGGTLPYVDHDRPRDVEMTEEIMAATTSAVLVDERGDIVAEFEGPDGWQQAEQARRTAKLTFSVDIAKPKTRRASPKPDAEGDPGTEDAG